MNTLNTLPHTADITPAIAITEPEAPKQNQKNNATAIATAAISSAPIMASTAMCTGQLVTQSCVPATAALSADMQRLHSAMTAIPASATLGKLNRPGNRGGWLV